MGSSSATSGGVSSGTSEGTIDQTVHVADDQRKRKRMLSNRESARRSRMRKQKHLDELVSQAGELKKENDKIATSVTVTAQLYARVEAENSVLRAQLAELNHRLHSLNDITNCISNNNCVPFDTIGNGVVVGEEHISYFDDHSGDFNAMIMMMTMNNNNNPWNFVNMNQPITASADQMCMY